MTDVPLCFWLVDIAGGKDHRKIVRDVSGKGLHFVGDQSDSRGCWRHRYTSCWWVYWWWLIAAFFYTPTRRTCVMVAVCLSAESSVTREHIDGCQPDMGKGRPSTLEVSKFWCCSRSGMDSESLFHFPHHCGIGDFRRFLSISHTIPSSYVWIWIQIRISNHFWLTFWPWIWIKINREIQIRILNHFWLTFRPWIWIQINREIQIQIPSHFWLTFWPWRSLHSLNLLFLLYYKSVLFQLPQWILVTIISLLPVA